MPQNRPRHDVDRVPQPIAPRPPPPRKLAASDPAQKGDGRRAPIVESGLAIEPEDLGIQFLRGATETEQDASDFELRGEAGLPNALVTEAALSETDIEDELSDDEDIPPGIAGHENELVESVLAARDADEDELETDSLDADAVDLQSASIHDASLFDRPLDDEDMDEEQVLEENATLEPRVRADDVSGPDTRRERLIQRGRDALLARRTGGAKPNPR
jgi:hypothetical protein